MLSLTNIVALAGLALLLAVTVNVFRQICLPKKSEPPVVFHWVPFLGSTITYGTDPYKFLFSCREKYGDIFTFILLGRRTTVYLGIAGNEFILNCREKDANAEEIYGPLCNPVFGSDVCYDCPNAKLMEQKKFIKYGLTQEALINHVHLIEDEVLEYINKNAPSLKGNSGTVNIADATSQITIFTASRTLQGDEVRSKLNNEFGALFHDLEKGFRPINFMLPWFPLPHNRKRDAAHARMRAIYMDIIQKRRQGKDPHQTDMIWNLMRCVYKNGTPMPDKEIAHIMITLLMAGQHSSANISAWILLHLANEPEMAEKLYTEQLENLPRDPDGSLARLRHEDLDKLPLHANTVKETLRIHNSIHSILRQVKNPMPVPGTSYTIPAGDAVLASPGITAKSAEYFPEPNMWNPHRWENNTVDQDDETDMVDYGYGRVSKGTRSPYLPFGGGRHRCVGEKFAYINLVVIIATMVRTFKFRNLEGVTGVPETDYSNLFSSPMQPAVITWERRDAVKGR